MQPLGVVRLSMPISLATGASPRSSATQTAPFSRRWASTSPVPTAFGRVRIGYDDQRDVQPDTRRARYLACETNPAAVTLPS